MLVVFDLDGTLFQAKLVLPDIPPDDAGYHEALVRNVRERGMLFPGVIDVLFELRDAGFQMCVCSASSLDYIEAALDSTGIRPFFRSIHGAPGRDGKAEIFKTLALPGAAVAVGDTWRDMDAARQCGFLTVAALYGYGKRELIVADAYAETVEQLPKLIFGLCAHKP